MAAASPWRSAIWKKRALAWARRRIADQGLAAGKTTQFHVRPWSTVFRIATARDPIYFKAVWPLQRPEVGISDSLAAWRPNDVAGVPAIDERRGWFLMEDAGIRLREVLAKDKDVRHWHRIVPRYAELQLAVATHVSELLAHGAPDRRGEALPGAYEQLLRKKKLLRVGAKDGLSEKEHARLLSLVPRVRDWCEQIAGSVPDSINHDDLHDGQVFVKNGHYRVLDWGDANVSHPFCSLAVVLRSVGYTFKLTEDSPELRRIVDLYLEPFTTVATMSHLRDTYQVARRLGRICRALTWAAVIPRLPPAWQRRERSSAAAWLQIFLESV
ncbi:MAG TPA: phosphotransferase [Candidatus Limnocylindria bacterium]